MNENIVVVLSGGKGVRFGDSTPKQYHKVLGRDVISYPIKAAQKSKLCGHVVVAASEEYIEYLSQTYGVECCMGGDTHNRSVKNALDYVQLKYPDCEKILFADSARPFISGELIDEYFPYLDHYDSVITAQKITDSLGYEGVRFTSRANYYLIQKPEAFLFKTLYDNFDAESECTAVVQQMPQGSRIMKYFKHHQNLKITGPADILIAEQLMRMRGDN